MKTEYLLLAAAAYFLYTKSQAANWVLYGVTPDGLSYYFDGQGHYQDQNGKSVAQNGDPL